VYFLVLSNLLNPSLRYFLYLYIYLYIYIIYLYIYTWRITEKSGSFLLKFGYYETQDVSNVTDVERNIYLLFIYLFIE